MGRTEADIQSDVRTFLLAAPLELDEQEVVDVSLEAPVEGGGRIDVEAGFAVIEVKKSVASPRAVESALVQLAHYVRRRTEERGQRYVGILTDGRTWMLTHLGPDGRLVEVSRFVVTGGDDAPRLAAWLEPVLASSDQVAPVPDEIKRRLGASSAAAQLDLAGLRALYHRCRDLPEVRIKRELWARLLVSALGTNFEDSDELFVVHTYLVLEAELIAHEILKIRLEAYHGDLRSLLEGQQFELAGLHGVVEADFFDWPVSIEAGVPIVKGIARRLSRFAWSNVDHDVLKILYESVIDKTTRKRLGEYYTPDWLAQKMVDEHVADPMNQRILDPACGSGTFLFWTIRKIIEACDSAGIPDREMLEHVVSHVFGMDLHPVAVTLARVTYLLALGPDRIATAERGELAIPVFLGDSLRWEQDQMVKSERGITVKTSAELELFDQELSFPEGVVEEPARFDRLVEALASKAASRRTKSVPGIEGILRRHRVESDDQPAVALVFTKLCRLHDAGRNHLWSYYIRNLARPASFAAAGGQVDVLVGNPPWLAYRHMPQALQKTYRVLAEERGLWAGAGSAPHQDLSDLFAVRAIEQYLRSAGRFVFVMPFSSLSRLQFEGFRSGHWAPDPDTAGTDVEFSMAEDYSRVKPAIFPTPACVISGRRAASPLPLPSAAIRWSGRLPATAASWSKAREVLIRSGSATERATRGSEGAYRMLFRQGATLVPRVLLKVEKQARGPLGGRADRVAVQSSRVAVEKDPWKGLHTLTGRIEPQFVHPTHLGASIVAFRARAPEMAVIPLLSGQLLDGGDPRLDEYDGLADWWRRAEELWEHNKAPGNRLSLKGRINYQSGVTAQVKAPEHRVVYTRSGQYIAACRIDDPQVIVEQTLYWAPARTIDEARYLVGILNSGVVAAAALPLQSRGQHNPRDFATTIFAVAFPLYDPTIDLHNEIAALAERAERVAAELDFPVDWQFQKARRKTREALRHDGVTTELDRAVQALTVGTAHGAAQNAPDLLAVLEERKRNIPSVPRRRKAPATSGRKALQKSRRHSPRS